jgi:hypothetical protein
MSVGTIRVKFESSTPEKSIFTIYWENIKYNDCDKKTTTSAQVEFDLID